VPAALRYAFRYPYVYATCVGMTSESGLEATAWSVRPSSLREFRYVSPRRGLR